jgi:ferritin-like metal-binding protein YciE
MPSKTSGKSSTRTGKATKAKSNSPSTPSRATVSANGKLESKSPLHEYFMHLVNDMISAEKQLLPALKLMENQAVTSRLAEAIQDHHYLTQKHISRVEQVLVKLGEPASGKECKAMKGLIEEANETVQETPEDSMTRDAAIIIAAQKIEHYEIASYGGLVQLAITMGHHEIAELLDRTLLEEEKTDRFLTHIAENYINLEAEQEAESYIEDEE